MDMTELIKAAAGSGAWGLLAVFLIKYFMDDKSQTISSIEKNHKESMDDMKEDKDKLMEIVISQKELLTQQKEILSRQTEMLSQNQDTLIGVKMAIDKITEIQIGFTNRLDKIEDKVERVERQTLR